MPKISVIVPVYQAEAYLAECIDSILCQTFEDFELILVDDGSPDNCWTICREYEQRDSRVRVLQQENRGQAAARNHAMKLAQGQWICFVDSDDVIHPQMVELLYRAAAESGTDMSMCRYVEAAQLPDDFFQPAVLDYTILSTGEGGLVELYDREAYPGWVACTKLVRREIVEGYPFTEGRVFEDNEAVSRWICRVKEISSLDQTLYYYRTNPNSTTKSSFSLKKLDYLWALESITRFYGEIGYDKMHIRFFRRYVNAAVDSCYGVRADLKREDLAKDIAKRVKAFAREEKLSLTQTEFEALMDAAPPKWIRLYWIAAGIRRRLGLRKGERP